MELLVRSESSNALGLVVVGGEVDIATAPRFKEDFVKLFKQNQHLIIVDMLETRYFDASGLGVLAGALIRCRKMGGSIAVVCTAPHLIRIFSVTGMDAVFTIVQTQEKAACFLNNLSRSK